MKHFFTLLICFLLTQGQSLAQCSVEWRIDEDFSTTTLSNPPDCWDVETNPAAFDFNNGYASFSSSNSYLILPEVQNLTGVLTFDARQSSRFTLGGFVIELGVWQNGGFTSLTTYELRPPSWETFTYDLSNYTGTGTRLAFRANNSTYKTLIDNVQYQSACDNSTSATAVAKDITVQLDASGNVVVSPSQVDDGSYNSCEAPITNLSLDKTLFTCEDLGSNTVTLTADDGFGNLSTATAIINVEPTVEFGFTSVFLGNDGPVSVTDAFALRSTTTQCEGIVFTYSQDEFDCSDIGNVSFEITATYPGGQVVKTSTIQVSDFEGPKAVANDLSVTIDGTTGLAEITTEQADGGSTDNCGIVSLELSKSSFSCEDQGMNFVELKVFDAAGYFDVDTLLVTVNSYLPDVTVSSDQQEVCFDGENQSQGATITTDGSMVGAQYYLRNSADSSTIDGPIEGTGSGLTFNTGPVLENTTFQVYAEVEAEGKSLSLSGNGDHLMVATPGSFDYSTGYTLSLWVKERLGGISNSFDPLFYAGGANGSDIEVYLSSTDGKFIVVHNRDNGGTNDFLITETNFLPDDEFVHVTVTYDGTTVRVYKNGISSFESDLTAPLRSTASELSFGHLRNSTFPGYQSFDGKLDDIRVYGTARDAADIRDDFNRCLNGGESDLVLYFDLESISGTILTDKVNQTPAQLMDGGSLSDEFAVSCTYACNRVMSTEITVGDGEAPEILLQGLTVSQGVDGTTSVLARDFDAGSTDNCTSTENLIFTISQSDFDCDEVGENTVIVSVMDQAGNLSTAETTLTILPAIEEQSISSDQLELCPGSQALINMEGSQPDVYYSLYDESNRPVSGPLEGTGDPLSFNTGVLTSSKTFSVYGQLLGKESRVLAFDGEDDFIEGGKVSSQLLYDQGFSLETWVKAPLPGSTGGYPTIFCLGSDLVSDVEVYLQQGTNKLIVAFNRGKSSGFGGYEYPIPPDNEWFHLALTYDGENTSVFYNGVEQEATGSQFPGPLTRSENSELLIGTIKSAAFNPAWGSNKFKGELEDYRVFSIARTQEEINDQRDQCLLGDEPNLFTYFTFDNNETDTIRSQVGNVIGLMKNMDPMQDFLQDTVITCTTCGVSVSNTVSFTVEDVEVPTVLIKDITVFLNEDTNTVDVAANEVDDGSFDNCGSITLSIALTESNSSGNRFIEIGGSESTVQFNKSNLGTNVVVLNVEDLTGNVSTAEAIVTVEEARTAQTITFDQSFEGIKYGDPEVALSATASSGLEVSFASEGPVSIVDGILEFIGAGTATVTASQSGNEEFGAAESISISFNIDKAVLQATAEDKTMSYGDQLPDFTVSYSGFIGDDDPLMIDTAPQVSTDANSSSDVASYELIISGGEDDNYTLELISGTLTITPASQEITFEEIPGIDLADSNQLELIASASSGLEVSFSVIEGDGTVDSNNVLSLNSVGVYVVRAFQEGSINYQEASPIDQSFEVIDSRRTDQSISFDAIPNATYGDEIVLSGTSSSGLGVAYELTNGVGSIENGVLLIEEVGEYTIRAVQEGNEEFNPAPSIERSFTSEKALLEVTAEPLTIIEGDQIPELTYSVTGFVLGDDITELDELPVISTNATSNSAPGTYAIELSGGTDNHYEFQTVNGVLTIEVLLGLSQISLEVFPNPTTEKLYVQTEASEGLLLLYNTEGRMVRKQSIKKKQSLLDLSLLSPGIYVLMYENQGVIESRKVIKR